MSSLQQPLHHFHLFPKLPGEIRSKIFDMAIKEEPARIIEVKSVVIESRIGDLTIFLHETPSPPSIKTSREFLARALKVYTLLELAVGDVELPKHMQFIAHVNFNHDTLLLHPNHFERRNRLSSQLASTLDHFLFALEKSSSVNLIKSLAISVKFLDNTSNSSITAAAICHLVLAAKSLTKLRLVYQDSCCARGNQDNHKKAIAFTTNEAVDQVEHGDFMGYLEDMYRYMVLGNGGEEARSFEEVDVVADLVLR